MSDSEDAFEKLEERLLRVAEFVKQTHSERRAHQQELEVLAADLKERSKRIDSLERELQTLRREREEVRDRLEKLLRQVDLLAKQGPAD